ncbi:MAG: Fic family protein, partial [Patescibacteria group bacterium]
MNRTSTKPKGATSYKDTAFGILPRSKLIKLEIEGTKKGLEYLYNLFKREKEVRITPELIIKLHEVSFGWIFPKWAGKYRKIQVSLLAWFQHQFVFIHPFQDYNGRIARMLTILILLILHVPPIELTAKTEGDRKRYILAMQQADEGNFNLLEKLIGQALAESLDRI